MLNISANNSINESLRRFTTIRKLDSRPHYKVLNRIIGFVLLLIVVFMFLPWTQNVSGIGTVTALRPEQRPQTIHTMIGGRIEKWYVKEGDLVKKGDTILFISETKEEYLDPDLIENTAGQLEAKKLAQQSYGGKVASLDVQLAALNGEKQLKLEQARNKLKQAALKIKSDSIDLVAAKTQIKIAQTQYNRSVNLNADGLKPLSDVEEKRLKLQETEAKIITQENKIIASRNEYLNAQIEIGRISAEYDEKASKVKSDQFSAISSKFDTEAQVNKLKNLYANYNVRQGMYFITAPQSGYVNASLKSGLGEAVKPGTPVVSIMPADFDIAVEAFVSPNDLPLIRKGGKIRVWFDGWPTVVFSGWPGMSYGTYGGQIIAIEKFSSANGKFRVLIEPDPNEPKWPTQLSIGSGARALALLENVPIWFEIWRTLNGFPPNYYIGKSKSEVK